MQLLPIAVAMLILAVAPDLAFGQDHPKKHFASRNAVEATLQNLLQVRNPKGEPLRFKLAPKNTMQKEDGLWATLDSKKDGVEGTSTEKVHETYPGTLKKEIVVAVIDSGVDWKHEDLQGKIWVNEKEVPDNGVDDDGNGYIDDYRGWNFIGGFDSLGKPTHVGATTYEVTREYARLKKLAAIGSLSADQQAYFEKVSKELNKKLTEAQGQLSQYRPLADGFRVLREAGITTFDIQTVSRFEPVNDDQRNAKDSVLFILERGATEEDLLDAIAHYEKGTKFYFNPSYDPYSSTSPQSIVGDNPEKLDEVGYGNPDVIGPDASHGTHVAGIIAANRQNDFGIDGQAKGVKIMILRAVPDGDERDKDVANAIRYAVDHGADVINMSFGKPYSPHKFYVDEAMKYAESKNVLLVHAAGNDAKNTESGTDNFPNAKTLLGPSISTWIEVGASDRTKDQTLPANFSNWGKTSVDLFAPGVSIISTVPGNGYASFQGTSMAAPEVAGVAALLMNLYPNTSKKQIRATMIKSVTRYSDLMVRRPSSRLSGEPVVVTFDSLSITGGIVNAFRATRLLK